MSPPPPWSLLYADGSANAFRFDATAAGVTFTYEPVTVARSSSGVYDGGTPRAAHVGLDEPRLRALWAQIEALAADRACHAVARAKGDGAITIVAAGATRQLLIVRAATRELEALLAGSFGASSRDA